MAENFDYGFDLGAFIEREYLNKYEFEGRQPDETDLLLREFDKWDEPYVEFDDEVFDL